MTTRGSAVATAFHVVTVAFASASVTLIPTEASAQGRPSTAELQVEGEAVKTALDESGYFPAIPDPASEGHQYVSAVEVAFDGDIPAQSVRLRLNGNLDSPLSRPLTFVLAAVPNQGLYRLFEIRSLDRLDEDVARIGRFLESVAPERRRRRAESETEIRLSGEHGPPRC